MKNVTNSQILTSMETQEKDLAFKLEETRKVISSLKNINKGQKVEIPAPTSRTIQVKKGIGSYNEIKPRIEDLLEQNGPMKTSQIISSLQGEGFEVGNQPVRNLIFNMGKTKKYKITPVKGQRGFYKTTRRAPRS